MYAYSMRRQKIRRGIMSKGNVIIIGANEFQNPLILKAKELGYTTHVFAWQDGSVGERTADVFYPISIVETDQILDQCRKLNPRAVVSIGSDLAAITVNVLANQLGLPGNPPETAVIATNKYEMRRAFHAAGIPVPAFCKVGAEDDLSPIRSMRLPIIVKPTDRSGSRGIMKLTSFDGLEEAVRLSASVSFEKKAIVEEYIEGEEYSCECISQNGQHHFLTITRKFTTGAPHFIETGHLQPSGLDEATCEMVRQQIFKALDALHVTCGASHSEFKILPDTGEIRIIEIGARMAGDCIGSDLVLNSTGLDFVQMTLEAALGEPLSLQPVSTPKTAAIRFIFNQKDYQHYQTVVREHPERILRTSEIDIKEDVVVSDSSTRFGFYILTGGDDTAALADLT